MNSFSSKYEDIRVFCEHEMFLKPSYYNII